MIGFVGMGMMAEAIVKGLINSNTAQPGRVVACDPNPERIKVWTEWRRGVSFFVLFPTVAVMVACRWPRAWGLASPKIATRCLTRATSWFWR